MLLEADGRVSPVLGESADANAAARRRIPVGSTDDWKEDDRTRRWAPGQSIRLCLGECARHETSRI